MVAVITFGGHGPLASFADGGERTLLTTTRDDRRLRLKNGRSLREGPQDGLAKPSLPAH